jgi:catechol 2,3-dioxygenase-like lactoylglutathione lyase family enzyme
MKAATQLGTAAMEEAFRIKSADHTGFTVSSLDNSLAFWVDVLGFRHLYTWTFETEPFIEELVGVPRAAARIAMVEGPNHLIMHDDCLPIIGHRGYYTWHNGRLSAGSQP